MLPDEQWDAQFLGLDGSVEGDLNVSWRIGTYDDCSAKVRSVARVLAERIEARPNTPTFIDEVIDPSDDPKWRDEVNKMTASDALTRLASLGMVNLDDAIETLLG